MPNPYDKEQWETFREEVIELDGSACRRCNRTRENGAILQVHHEIYYPGRMPWDYRYEDCETLCKGCHSAEHGITYPKTGWHLLGDEDLEDLSGTCDCCGTSIRYVFHIHHPRWEPMGVGTVCCDNLTGTEIASNHMESLLRFRSRRSRFITSSRWKNFGYFYQIRQKEIELRIQTATEGFQIYMNDYPGKQRFKTVEAAKEFAFEVIEDGKAQIFLQKKNTQTSKV